MTVKPTNKMRIFATLVFALGVAGSGCAQVLPWPQEEPSDQHDGSALAGKTSFVAIRPQSEAELARFRALLVRTHHESLRNLTPSTTPRFALRSALYRGLVEQGGIPRQQIKAELAKLVAPQAKFCAGGSCARIFGLEREDLDSFLNEAYAFAAKAASIAEAERGVLLGSLRQAEAPRSKTLIFGHRGASAFYPENSLSAVKAAFAKVDGAEIDIQLTRDNVPVVLHDDSLRRTAVSWPENASLDPKRLDSPVSDLSWDDIKNVAIGPRGEKVPSFSSVLAELARHPTKRLLVEIKSYSQSDTALRVRMISALDKMLGVLHGEQRRQVILISFDEAVLRAAKGVSSLRDLECYWLLTGEKIEQAAQAGTLNEILRVADEFTGLDIESGSYLSRSLSRDKNIVQLLQERTKKVIVWISRRQRTDGNLWLQRARAQGVDIFTSDLPLDILYPARHMARYRQAMESLKKSIKGADIAGGAGDDRAAIVIGAEAFGFYAPTGADFLGLSTPDWKKAVETDITHVRALRKGVVVSLADLTRREQELVIDALKALPREVRHALRVLKPTLPADAPDRSVVDVSSAKARLRETSLAQSVLISL